MTHEAEHIRIMPMAGALTPFQGVLTMGVNGQPRRQVASIARVQYFRMFAAFSALGLQVDKPIVMRHGGIQNPYLTRHQTLDVIRHRRDKHPGSKAWIVAHSLAGVIAANCLANDPEGKLVAGVITLGSPLAIDHPVNTESEQSMTKAISLLEKIHLGKYRLVDSGDFVHNIDKFKSETFERSATNSAMLAGRLIVAGSPGDGVVPLASALANFGGAERHVLGAESFEDAQVHPEISSPTHLRMVSEKNTASFVVQATLNAIATMGR